MKACTTGPGALIISTRDETDLVLLEGAVLEFAVKNLSETQSAQFQSRPERVRRRHETPGSSSLDLCRPSSHQRRELPSPLRIYFEDQAN